VAHTELHRVQGGYVAAERLHRKDCDLIADIAFRQSGKRFVGLFRGTHPETTLTLCQLALQIKQKAENALVLHDLRLQARACLVLSDLVPWPLARFRLLWPFLTERDQQKFYSKTRNHNGD
jgi:hypothetical protein